MGTHNRTIDTWRGCEVSQSDSAQPAGDLAAARHALCAARAAPSQGREQLPRSDGRRVPAALFSLGLSLIDRKLTGNAAEIVWLTAVKLVAGPILTFALVTQVFVMDRLWSQAAVILSALPVGTSPYIIAQQYNVHVETVSSAVVVSTG